VSHTDVADDDMKASVLRCHIDPPRSVVGRICQILATFRAGSGHSASEIARLTGLPNSTTYRLVCDLASWQILHRDPDGTFRVGPALCGFESHSWSLSSLDALAPQVLIDLSEATQRRSRLGVLSRSRVQYAEKRVGPEPVMKLCAGATLPAHATALGKALLAYAPHDTVAALVDHLTVHTQRTLDSSERLHHALRTIRLTKVAVSDGELVTSDVAVAVPVFAPGGDVVAALEVEVGDPRVDFHMCRAAVTIAAAALSRELAARVVSAERSHLRIVPPLCDIASAPGLTPVRPASGD
jgi:DNA-binding IclR family transcriptional regulator